MKPGILVVLAILVVATVPVQAQPAQKQAKAPHAGYLYPAGGQQETTFTMYVGGQYLRSVTHVQVSGEGVRARVLAADIHR